MAKQIFKGFKQVAYSDSLTYENGYLYLVRTASGETADGFLYFNGKKYGTSQAAIAKLEAVLGELPSGETTFSAWIQKVASALTIEAAAREAMDESLLGDSTGETTEGATIYDVKRKVESISGSTHTHSNKEVLDTISAEKVATWDGTLASANTYTDEQYSAETARTESTYAKPADIATAIEALDASAVTVGASETVASVSETDGVITVTKQDIAISHSAVTDWDTELAKKQDVLVFKTAYDAETNKAVTESDIAFLEGAMHFVGVSSTNPVTEGPTIPSVTAFTSGDVCLYTTKEFIYDGTNWHEIGDEGIYVTKTTTIAGVDLQDNISKAELLSALTVEDGAQVNVLEGVKVNGTDLTVSGKSVDITITSGTTSGTVAVNGTDVAVTGLKSAAYEETTAFDAAGAAASAETSAKEYADTKIASAITALDATVSGESAQGVAVEITEANGVITNVTVTGPDLSNVYDEKGAAASAETSAKEYADTKIASAITTLDATVSGASSGNVTTVQVVEADGVVTAVNVTNNLSADSDNALSIKSDGLFAAIYYEDEDTV